MMIRYATIVFGVPYGEIHVQESSVWQLVRSARNSCVRFGTAYRNDVVPNITYRNYRNNARNYWSYYVQNNQPEISWNKASWLMLQPQLSLVELSHWIMVCLRMGIPSTASTLLQSFMGNMMMNNWIELNHEPVSTPLSDSFFASGTSLRRMKYPSTCKRKKKAAAVAAARRTKTAAVAAAVAAAATWHHAMNDWLEGRITPATMCLFNFVYGKI